MTTETQNVEPSPADDGKPHRRPYTPKYRVTRVPLSPDDQVQLSAVLRVIYPWVRGDPKRIIEATARVCQRWRTQAIRLSARGWGALGAKGNKSQLSNAMTCPPAFVMTYEKSERAKKKDKKHSGCCHLRQLCPFCWAREVRRYWLTIEPAFFPRIKDKKPKRQRQVDTGPLTVDSPPFTLRVKGGESLPRSPYDLVYRVFTFLVPVHSRRALAGVTIIDDAGEVKPAPVAFVVNPGLPDWLDSRMHGRPNDKIYRLYECRALLKAAGPGGGMLESIQYQQFEDSAGQYWWEIQVHHLILAADGDAVPKQLHPLATGQPKLHIVLHKPNRKILAKWMGKALRYPKLLIDPATPLDHVIEHLNVRRGRRLVVRYGCFRNRTLK